MKPARIFHITSAAAAAEGVASGTFVPAAFADEGFIHCSYAHQVCDVANRLFGGRTDLVLLEIDPGRLTCRVIDENLEGGTELFPHVYGPIPASASVAVHRFACDRDGRFRLPRGCAGPARVQATCRRGAAPHRQRFARSGPRRRPESG